jgi:hypothetical protein
MIKSLYLTCLATLLFAALFGFAYCLFLLAQGESQGLANIGKSLLVALYCIYRMLSLLNRRYQIYRIWESALVKKTKKLLHASMFLLLCLLAFAVLATLSGVLFTLQAPILLLASLLAVFFALEALNALNPDPMVEYEQAR